MEKIWILGADGKYEEASEIDEAIKEVVKKKNKKKDIDEHTDKPAKRTDGTFSQNQGVTDTVAPDATNG